MEHFLGGGGFFVLNQPVHKRIVAERFERFAKHGSFSSPPGLPFRVESYRKRGFRPFFYEQPVVLPQAVQT